MSEQSATTKASAEPQLCKMDCGFFVSSEFVLFGDVRRPVLRREGRRTERNSNVLQSPLLECGLAGAISNLALHKHGRAVYVPAVALAWRNFSARGTGQE